MKRLQVALAFPGGFEFGGIGRMMLYATAAFQEMPHQPVCTVLDARGTGSILLMPAHLLTAMARLVVARLAGRLDLLHLNVAGRGSTLRKIFLSETAVLLRLPTVVHLHDYDYRSDLAKRSRIGRYFIQRMFRRAERVILLGLRDQATVIEMLNVRPARTIRLANAVPDPRPPATPEGPAGPAVRLLFLGHLDDRKGVPELLQALAAPRLRTCSWHVDLAGGGEVPRFQAMAAELGIADRATFHGWLRHDEVYALCRQADMFVLPSHAEGQAMSLLEAMAHGLAIVATPVGAHLEAVTPGKEACLVSAGDVDGLTGALAALIDDPHERRRLGAAARQRYLADFTVTGYAAKLLEIYEAALRDTELASPRHARVSSELKG